MGNVEYKPANHTDIQLLVDLKILFSDERVGKQDTATEKKMRGNLTNYFIDELNKTYFCWYAIVDEAPASIAGMCIRTTPGSIKNPSGKWGYIMNVYTLQQYRRMGLCNALIKLLMSTGQEQGVTAFELHATQSGASVYVKNGFKLHNQPTYRKFI